MIRYMQHILALSLGFVDYLMKTWKSFLSRFLSPVPDFETSCHCWGLRDLHLSRHGDDLLPSLLIEEKGSESRFFERMFFVLCNIGDIDQCSRAMIRNETSLAARPNIKGGWKTTQWMDQTVQLVVVLRSTMDSGWKNQMIRWIPVRFTTVQRQPLDMLVPSSSCYGSPSLEVSQASFLFSRSIWFSEFVVELDFLIRQNDAEFTLTDSVRCLNECCLISQAPDWSIDRASV